VLSPGEALALWAMMATSADIFPFLKASQWRYSVSPHTPGENPRSSDRVLAALPRRDLLEDATFEFSCRATLRCLGGGCPPLSALLDKASFVSCTRGVSRWALPWCSSSVCELCWSIPADGRWFIYNVFILLIRQ
jgi:hypothetical protein